ncbi:MAG: tetratricopeptide repeat protein [Kiritimatiellaeota bacterium]|nr:tetratricopeptide repeat protein [Kiritimatiellota bacterium]
MEQKVNRMEPTVSGTAATQWVAVVVVALLACRFTLSAGAAEEIATLQAKSAAGDARAQALLARAYEDGDAGLPRNYKEAARLAHLSAQQNHPYGLFALARLYQRGKGVVGNEEIAKGLFIRAREGLRPLAEQGDAEAQGSLGVIYLFGWGVQKDAELAFKWLRQSARSYV